MLRIVNRYTLYFKPTETFHRVQQVNGHAPKTVRSFQIVFTLFYTK